MWVFTKLGFYSIVEKSTCSADELEVRSRCRKDLERLRVATKAKTRILKNAGTDYPFRIRMKREAWAKFLADSAMEIDYQNFKDEVLFSKGEGVRARRRRHSVYHDVWKALLRLGWSARRRCRSSKRDTTKESLKLPEDWYAFPDRCERDL